MVPKYSVTADGDYPGNTTTTVRQPVFYGPKLFPIILNTLKTRLHNHRGFQTATTIFYSQLAVSTLVTRPPVVLFSLSEWHVYRGSIKTAHKRVKITA